MMYDPARTAKGHLALKAYRLSDQCMTAYAAASAKGADYTYVTACPACQCARTLTARGASTPHPHTHTRARARTHAHTCRLLGLPASTVFEELPLKLESLRLCTAALMDLTTSRELVSRTAGLATLSVGATPQAGLERSVAAATAAAAASMSAGSDAASLAAISDDVELARMEMGAETLLEQQLEAIVGAAEGVLKQRDGAVRFASYEGQRAKWEKERVRFVHYPCESCACARVCAVTRSNVPTRSTVLTPAAALRTCSVMACRCPR
ncbi:hypothetical protein EON67_03605, partial [archaeon]